MSVKQTVDIKHVSEAIDKILQTYSYDMQVNLEKCIKNAGTRYVKHIKEEWQKEYDQKTFTIYNSETYQNCFSTKNIGTLARRLRNTEYRLSHLLENGHKVANQYGRDYDIHPTQQTNGFWVWGSEYGTSGKTTRSMGFFKKTYEYMEKDLPESIARYVKKVKP